MIVACETCGKEFSKKNSQIAFTKRHYCCRECWLNRIKRTVEITCASCGESFLRYPSEVYEGLRFCSQKCYGEYLRQSQRGSMNPSWLGGEKLEKGYRLVLAPDNPMARANGYVFEHRLVMSQHLGRPLTRDEVVHHTDGNTLNNDITNLQLMTRKEHSRFHKRSGEVSTDYCSD